MSTPVAVAAKMEDARDLYRQAWGDDYDRKMGDLVRTVNRAAKAKGADPFQFAVKEAIRAGEGPVAWQLTAAACEIAEGEL